MFELLAGSLKRCVNLAADEHEKSDDKRLPIQLISDFKPTAVGRGGNLLANCDGLH